MRGRGAPLGLPLSLSGGWDGICYCRTGCGCVFRWVGEGKIEKAVWSGCVWASSVWREDSPSACQSIEIPTVKHHTRLVSCGSFSSLQSLLFIEFFIFFHYAFKTTADRCPTGWQAQWTFLDQVGNHVTNSYVAIRNVISVLQELWLVIKELYFLCFSTSPSAQLFIQ